MGRQLSLPQIKRLLSPEQITVAHDLIENEFTTAGRLTYAQLAEKHGITARTLYNWRKTDPAFMAYINELAEVERESFLPIVYAQLHKAIVGGNNGQPSIRAIDLYLKLSGKLVERQEVITMQIERPTLSRKEVSEGIAKLNEFIDK